MSAVTSAIGGLAGGIIGMGNAQGDKDRAEKAYSDALAAAKGYNTHAADQKGTEFDRMDPTSRDAMLRAMTEYQNKASQGGLDAVARANLAQSTAAGEQAAQASSGQIAQQAARAGRLQGPAAQIQAQVAAQQGAERARMGGMDSAAMAEQARMAALQGGLGAAGMVNQADARRAMAQDQINRFNVQNAQLNIANDRARAGMVAGINEDQAGNYEGRARRDVKEMAGEGKAIGGAVGTIGTFGMGQIGQSAADWGDAYAGSYGMGNEGT